MSGRWNPCASPGKNFGKFKTGSASGRSTIAIWWDGGFPDGKRDSIRSYGCSYWYKGRGFQASAPLDIFDDFFSTYGRFPVDDAAAGRTAEQVRAANPCAGRWDWAATRDKASQRREERRVVSVWWNGDIPAEQAEWNDFCGRITTTFSFEGREYRDVLPIRVEVHVGVTWGIFAVDNNAQWRSIADKWEHADYDSLRVWITLADPKKLSSNDLANEAARIPATFTVDNRTFTDVRPASVKQEMFDKIVGTWVVWIQPPDLFGWWPYNYKITGSNAVEVKFNFQYTTGRPNYTVAMALRQAKDARYTRVLLPNDASKWTTRDQKFPDAETSPRSADWALQEFGGGNLSAGFSLFMSKGPPPFLGADPNDKLVEGQQNLVEGVGGVLTAVGSVGSVLGSVGSGFKDLFEGMSSIVRIGLVVLVLLIILWVVFKVFRMRRGG